MSKLGFLSSWAGKPQTVVRRKVLLCPNDNLNILIRSYPEKKPASWSRVTLPTLGSFNRMIPM